MPNHFHLHIKTLDANLSRFMQSLLTSFTLSINKKCKKSGHLFQGRFKAQLVDGPSYNNKLSRYIHLNPVKTTHAANMSLSARKNLLKKYEWSSYKYYIGLKEKPKWFNRRFILSNWGSNSLEEKIKNYRLYTEKGLLEDNMEDLSQNTLHNIIGTDSFRDKIIRKYLKIKNGDVDSREQPELAKLKSISFELLIDAVMEYYHIKNKDQILVRKGSNIAARKVAIYFASEYCRRGLNLSQIAEQFNLKLSGLNTSRDKLLTETMKSKFLKTEFKNIRAEIEKRKTEV
jgi:putative transposase